MRKLLIIVAAAAFVVACADTPTGLVPDGPLFHQQCDDKLTTPTITYPTAGGTHTATSLQVTWTATTLTGCISDGQHANFVSYTVRLEGEGQPENETITTIGTTSHTFAKVLKDGEEYTVKVTANATESSHKSETSEVTFTVDLGSQTDIVGPAIIDLLVTPNPAAVNTSIVITATIDDTDFGNSDIAGAHYFLRIAGNKIGGDVPMTASDGAFDSPIEDVEPTIPGFTEPKVYQLCVQAWDVHDNTTTECVLFAVYDPSAGFVTGGGWIGYDDLSCPVLCEGIAGRADFGFVARYQRGAHIPTGNTQFEFHAGTLQFKSTVYEWLVVAGNRAQFKGSGTINGEGNYGFLLMAIDGKRDGPDAFRMKIVDGEEVVFDNQMGKDETGDDATLLDKVNGNGSIMVHSR
jgi:hypothetical protein